MSKKNWRLYRQKIKSTEESLQLLEKSYNYLKFLLIIIKNNTFLNKFNVEIFNFLLIQKYT